MLDRQFINNCTMTESPYALMQFILKREQMSTTSRSSKLQASASTFEDHRHERANFAVIHDSHQSEQGQMQRFFENQKAVNCQIRFCHEGLPLNKSHGSFLSKFLCSLSDRVTRWSWNIISGPEDTCELSFHLYNRLFTSAKIDAEIWHTYPCVQTDSG